VQSRSSLERIVASTQIALDTLRASKVRSALTILGIVIGVTSVISVAAIIEGLNKFIQDKVTAFGPKTMFIGRFPAGTDPNRLGEKFRLRKYLNYSDAQYIREHCPSIASATAFGTRAFFFGNSNDVRYGSERVERVILRGVEPEYADAIPMFHVEHGRFISRYDEDHARPVTVIGAAVANSLFGGIASDAIGKTVRTNGKLYEVVGVLAHDSGLFGFASIDDFVLIPLSEFRKRYPEAKEVFIAFVPADEVPIDTARDEVVEAMRRVRRVPMNAESDFEIFASDFLSTLWNQLTGALVILTGVISSVGLLVGGIGVMNIMLISVTERTREIGIRKAVGARKSEIRSQFLIEAIVLTLVGGVLGILAGAGIAFLVRTVMPSVPATLSYLWIALGVGISIAVGLFFGYYPANRAANLDPIICLRYE
jgi:putative ABC transport system permease protein